MADIRSKLKQKLKKGDQVERCGLLLDDGTIIETENKHDFPEQGFRIPASELVKYERKLTGTWHTHPNGTANLSSEDHEGFRQWPRLLHFIIGTDGVRCFEVQDNFAVEV